VTVQRATAASVNPDSSFSKCARATCAHLNPCLRLSTALLKGTSLTHKHIPPNADFTATANATGVQQRRVAMVKATTQLRTTLPHAAACCSAHAGWQPAGALCHAVNGMLAPTPALPFANVPFSTTTTLHNPYSCQKFLDEAMQC
jgi:hypothetical protein